MRNIPKITPGLLALAFLCLGSVMVARADTITFVGNRTTTNSPPPTPDLGRCGGPAPPILLVSLPPGTGTSNLGAFTTNESHCVNRATGSLFNGLFTFNLGSGNTFFGTYTGTIDLSSVIPGVGGIAPVTETLSITNGTGLFAGASGSLAGVGTGTFFSNGFSDSNVTYTGTIRTVPEPTTMLLFSTGLAGVAGAMRKRREAGKSKG